MSAEVAVRITQVVGVEKAGRPLGDDDAILSYGPNPTAGATVIEYSLRSPARVLLTAYDIGGRIVAESALGHQSIGAHRLSWDGHGSDGTRLAAGAYFVRLTSAGRPIGHKRIIVLR